MMNMSCHWRATRATVSPGREFGRARSNSSSAGFNSACEVVTVFRSVGRGTAIP